MKSSASTNEKKCLRKIILVTAGSLFASALVFFICIYISAQNVKKQNSAEQLTQEQAETLEKALDSYYKDERDPLLLKALPYKIKEPHLNINAKSAIIVDTLTGSILYEKNADEQIPPASMTKIVEMFVVLSECKKGNISLNDKVPLPPESWSVNLPQDASRMFLSEGENVTLKELMLGLAIASGNDASIATAHYVAGTMQDFVNLMNEAVKEAGLTKTHFVESSGYSEENVTTAKEFARFARLYINTFPESLALFHSQKKLAYPQEKNFSEKEKKEALSGKRITIEQENTNKLLEVLEGCDGLKTGFINESGYNIAVTAERNGTRILCVTMGGPGSNTQEGNIYRVADNTALAEWAFSSFKDLNVTLEKSITIPVAGSKTKAVNLVPAFSLNLTSPSSSVQVHKIVPQYLFDEVECAKEYGRLEYMDGETLLYTVPLVADRSASKGSVFSSLVSAFLKKGA